MTHYTIEPLEIGRRKADSALFLFLTDFGVEIEIAYRLWLLRGPDGIVVVDTPEALKASVGKDRVQIHTDDDQAAIAALGERFGVEAAIHNNAVSFAVESGEEFVPRLFAELDMPIRSVAVSRPSLDDVFMSYTGTTIRDAEASAADANRARMAAWSRRG